MPVMRAVIDLRMEVLAPFTRSSSYLNRVYRITIKVRETIKAKIDQIGCTKSFSFANAGFSFEKAIKMTPPTESMIPKISTFFSFCLKTKKKEIDIIMGSNEKIDIKIP